MRGLYIRAACFSAMVILSISSTDSVAFPTYSSNGETGNCADCHGDFNGANYTSNSDDSPWGDDLMGGHRSFIDDTGNDECDVCLSGPNKSPVLLNLSDLAEKPNGCVGCHGREEDITANDGTFGGVGPGRGDGLRARHMGADGYVNWPGGIPGGLTCAFCHSADTTPVGEDVLPFNYSVAGTIGNPCTGEAVFGLTGLDNDGDGAYDTADTDCSPAVPTPGDFDFDGKADIVWRHAMTEQVYFWQMNGPEIASSSSVATPSTLNWEIAGTGDYNGDNKADILWRNSVTRQVYYWQMDGSTITSSSSVATPSDSHWQVIGGGDYDGDQKSDIMWRHSGVGGTGQIYYWKMDGSTIMSSAPVAVLADLDWKVVGSGDYDGDTKSDIMWRHELTGQVYYWRMNGSTITSSAKVATPPDLKWRVVGNGDYNGDTKDDLLWRNIGVGGTGKVYYWQMDGATITSSSRVSIVSDLDWKVVGDGDYNGDSKADVLWLHGTTGQIFYWQQDGATTVAPSGVSTLSDLNWEVVYTE